jgi:hypothetical protein
LRSKRFLAGVGKNGSYPHAALSFDQLFQNPPKEGVITMKSENRKSRGIETLSELCGAIFSEALVRQVQEQGFMLPAKVRLGSQVMEVYTPLDKAAGVTISESLQEGLSLCEAIETAEHHVIDCYALAKDKEYHVKGFSERRELLSDLRVKKLLDFTELSNVLAIESDALGLLLEICGCRPFSLATPWGELPFYREEDYLMLRYAKRLILEEGIDTETALEDVLAFRMNELWCIGE